MDIIKIHIVIKHFLLIFDIILASFVSSTFFFNEFFLQKEKEKHNKDDERDGNVKATGLRGYSVLCKNR